MRGEFVIGAVRHLRDEHLYNTTTVLRHVVDGRGPEAIADTRTGAHCVGRADVIGFGSRGAGILARHRVDDHFEAVPVGFGEELRVANQTAAIPCHEGLESHGIGSRDFDCEPMAIRQRRVTISRDGCRAQRLDRESILVIELGGSQYVHRTQAKGVIATPPVECGIWRVPEERNDVPSRCKRG